MLWLFAWNQELGKKLSVWVVVICMKVVVKL
jgi:hypothetical protein